jgi:hypothetical protein
MIDENLPHQSRRNREELRAVLPSYASQVYEAQVRLVDERGRSERVIGPLRTQSPARDPTQIVIHNLDQPAGRDPIALAPRYEQPRHIVFVRHAIGPGDQILCPMTRDVSGEW